MKFPIFALALLCAHIAHAQDAPAAPPKAPPTLAQAQAALSDGYVEFSANQNLFDDARGIGVYNGDVTATQKGEDFILYAQKATSFRKNKTDRPNDTATATDKLRIETRESTIRGRDLFANFDTKVFSITGDVVVSSYGENDGVAPVAAAKRRDEQKRQPVRIACDRLDWNYDTRQATFVGNIRIVQGDSVGTCNQIIYDEPKNAARLLGDVRFGNAEKRQFFADELLLFVDTSQVQIDSGVRVIGPVNNDPDGKKPAPKVAQAFPEPATIGDVALPKPPPDIEKFLPKPGVPTGKPPVIPAEKPAPDGAAKAPDKTEPDKAPVDEPKADEPKAEGK